MINNTPFALKIYHQKRHASDIHGPFPEINAGLYFSRKPLKDLARFYAGNPVGNWALYEFITPQIQYKKRKGKSLADFSVWNTDKEVNTSQGMQIDYGGMIPRNSKRLHAAISQGTPTKEEQEGVPNLFSYPLDERMKHFSQTMKTNNPVIQDKAVLQISSLPEMDREEAFRIAMKTKNDRVMEHAAQIISELPSTFQEEAFDMVMKTNNPYIQMAAILNSAPSQQKLVKKVFLTDMQTYHPWVQASFVASLKNWKFEDLGFPKDYETTVFSKALATRHPLVQLAAMASFLSLSDEVKKEALKQTNEMKTIQLPNHQTLKGLKMISFPI